MIISLATLFLAITEPEFQELLSSDPVLIELERQKIPRGEETFALLQVLGGDMTINQVKIQPLTLAAWSLLWILDSPFCRKNGLITELDTDILLYILSKGITEIDCELSDIPRRAFGLCREIGLDYDEARSELLACIQAAFRPLGMLPLAAGDGEAGEEEMIFDVDWMTRISCCVAPLLGLPIQRIMSECSLTLCCYAYLQYRRKLCPDAFFIRQYRHDYPGMVMERTMELARKYFAGKHGIAPEALEVV